MRDASRLLSNSRRCYLHQLVKPCKQYHCILWLAIMLCFGVMLRFVLYICNFSYYIFATFRIIYLQFFVLYICNFSYYIFATFRIIYLQLFVLYICNFSYYIFDTLRIIYLQLRIIKSHFCIIKLGYVLKIYVRIVNNRFVFFSLLARHIVAWTITLYLKSLLVL